MMARITSLARRANLLDDREEGVLVFGPYCVNMKSNTVSRNGETVPLTTKEFEPVSFLFRNLGRIVPRAHMMENVWGHSTELNTRTADTPISRIRNKLGLASELWLANRFDLSPWLPP